MTSPDKPASTVQPGDILAEKYRVERVLGQGGMGVVVLAEHIELRERVAIKFLLDTPADNAELAERFVREARAAVKIKSEHVVRVIDVGRLPTGAPYMVMEYLEGEDLSQRLMSGRVPIEDAVDYVIQSCEAMQVAHRTGIVHRDLKPANLFLTQRPDGSSLIKVLDFGISKVKSADAAQLSLTHTQAMMGSPLYMSPEQMRSSKDVSPSADIWSLGVILHELIAGDVPFTGTTFPEVLVQVMSEPPPKLRTLRPEVPEGLEAAVLRCLEKDPADRFSSVANLAVALTPYASSRTLGLQARLRASVSRPAPALAVPAIKLIQSTQVVVDGPMIGLPEAVAPTSPAPAPDPSSALAAPVIVAAREHAKTNTAWAEQSAGAATRSGGARRIGLIAAGALGVVGLIAAVLLRPSANGSSAAPAASPPPAALAAPAHEAPAADSSLKPAPKIMPLVEPPPTSAEPPAPAASASGDAPSEPRAAAAAPDEHTSAAAPTATSPEPVSAPATAPRPAARRSQPKASTEASARARAGAAASSKPAPGAAATPPPRPAAHQPA
ncbi:MAG TPA: serine/threonine-protein kinase, partial [Polyangiaceae bacterium]|nr:serine/threonine-protein kinase [Polyangiaceae bacterium]